MKKYFLTLLFLGISFIVYAQHDHHTTKSDTTKSKAKSPRLTAMAMVGNSHVHIDYGSPSVRGRSIWNGLVAYNQVWATGAHKATWIEFGEDVIIGGKTIPKGKYGFFTIPNKKEWILIISKDWDMHLADAYNPKNDIIRLTVKPKKNKKMVETLTYQVISTNTNKGKIIMSWEKLNVSFEFRNK